MQQVRKNVSPLYDYNTSLRIIMAITYRFIPGRSPSRLSRLV
jgi:hypothetical protein